MIKVAHFDVLLEAILVADPFQIDQTRSHHFQIFATFKHVEGCMLRAYPP